MRLAGLDIATCTGLALMEGDNLVHAESYKATGDNDGEIFLKFENWLKGKLSNHGVKHVAIEQPLRTNITYRNKVTGEEEAISNMRTYLRLYGLRAVALKVCAELNLPAPEEVNQATWRKAFLGNARGDKADAMRQCKLLRWKVPNLDAAEACGVAFWLGGHLRLTRAVRPGDLFSGQAA